MQLLVTPEGRIKTIYIEALPLDSLGRLHIARGSHVEPTDDGRWTTDLTPVGGPLLGPFDRRSQALDAEVAWLETHWLAAGTPG